MKSKIELLPVLLVGLFCLIPVGACSLDDPAAEAHEFQEQIEQATADSRIPGLVVALREPDGRELIAAVGTADVATGEAMRTDHSFYAGTISQSMLAVVILMLEEEGRLSLDDPISNYLEFPGGEQVTVQMLLYHSSGFADWTGRDLATTDNPRMPGLLESPQTIDSLLAVAAANEPSFTPGERQEACYTNMLLLDKLIETVEGKPAQTVLDQRIFEPLGLASTRYLQADENLESLAAGYRAEAGWGEPLDGGLTEAGWADDNLRALADMGIVSTAEDVLKYHVGLREGRLISAAAFERMRTVRPGKINGMGYLVMSGGRGTFEGNTGHAVGHLGINLFNVDKGFYLVVMGNLGDTGLPVAQIYDIRYGESLDRE